jgi:hypothetical protein
MPLGDRKKTLILSRTIAGMTVYAGVFLSI